MENKTETRGRKIPKGEKRTARDKLVGVYFSKEEVEILDEQAKLMGYRSKSAMISDLLAGPIQDRFTGMSFIKLGNAIANLKDKRKVGKLRLSSLWSKIKLNPEEVKDE